MVLEVVDFVSEHQNRLEHLDSASSSGIRIIMNAIFAGIPEGLEEEEIPDVIRSVLYELQGILRTRDLASNN